ncbi:MAG: hypothetical protein E7678_05565, partial [Ruminococcaceae bacterium]|nr:hypothetical protein [Oscillospiraceae bacterium]
MNEEYLRHECLQKSEIPKREELLYELNYMQMLVSGRLDTWFCNNFLGESVQLLINSIFLMEDGFFDCAFYSIRQSAENMNNMLLLASDKTQLSVWKSKGRFDPDSRVKEKLKKVDSCYKEIREKLTVFFDEFDGLIKDSHKIIHKQGFDSFYKLRRFQAKEIGFSKENEIIFFDKLIRYSICRLYIFFIILDPIGLILADSELNKKLNFAPMTEPIHLDFISKNYSVDLIFLIRETDFYKELTESFADKEEMNPYVYDVIREQYFDVEHLDEINLQKHLLNYSEQFILYVLRMGLKVSEFHVGGISILPYWTSIQSNYDRCQWSSNEFDEYLNGDIKSNIPYHNVYLSFVIFCDEPLFLQHNELLSE